MAKRDSLVKRINDSEVIQNFIVTVMASVTSFACFTVFMMGYQEDPLVMKFTSGTALAIGIIAGLVAAIFALHVGLSIIYVLFKGYEKETDLSNHLIED